MGNPYLRGSESMSLSTSILNVSVEACPVTPVTPVQNDINSTIYNVTNSNSAPSSNVASNFSSSTVGATATGYNVNISNITASSQIAPAISNKTSASGRRKRGANSPAADSTIHIDITTARNWGQLINETTKDEFGMITHCYIVDNATHPFLFRVTPYIAGYNATNATLLVDLGTNYEPTPLHYDFMVPENTVHYLPPQSKNSNVTQYCIGVQSALGKLAYCSHESSIDLLLRRELV